MRTYRRRQLSRLAGGIAPAIDNTPAFFEQGGKILADLDPAKPYIGAPTNPGEIGPALPLNF
jgi:hypothetical protein